MADQQHYATLADVAAASGLAAPIYTVGPTASGAVFSTVQEGVDEAKQDIEAATVTRALVLIYPGTYLEDVQVRCNEIHLRGLGSPGSVVIRSVTISDATAASITVFNGSGTFTDLALDAALTNPPVFNSMENITCYRDAAAGAWAGAQARASLRLLGTDVAAGTFLSTGFKAAGCSFVKASAAGAGTGGIVACYTNSLEVYDTPITGGIITEQCAVMLYERCSIAGTGIAKETYDSTGTIPATAYSGITFRSCQVEAELELNGDVARAVGRETYFGTVDVNTTGAASASVFRDCHCEGALDIGVANPTVTWAGGEVVVQPSGAGLAGFTQTNRLVVCDTLPGTDNARNLGSTALAYASVHSRLVAAHNDNTDSVKATLISSSLTPKGNNFTVQPATAANDVGGYTNTLQGGKSGGAAANPGVVGGTATAQGGTGGDGTGALAAGAGGALNLTGGTGGQNGGGGGNNGGAVVIQGGTATGAGVGGKVTLQASGSAGTEIGNAVGNPPTSFLGTGVVAVAGDVDCEGCVRGRKVVTVPGAYPYAVQADDEYIPATAGAGGVVVNLPDALAANVGEIHTVVHIDAGAGGVAVTPKANDQINGLGNGNPYNLAAQWNTVTVIVTALHQWLVVAHE